MPVIHGRFAVLDMIFKRRSRCEEGRVRPGQCTFLAGPGPLRLETSATPLPTKAGGQSCIWHKSPRENLEASNSSVPPLTPQMSYANNILTYSLSGPHGADAKCTGYARQLS